MAMFLIDTHTHVYDPEFDLDREETVQRALDAGVGMLLLPNVDASTIRPMLETNERFPDCTRVMMYQCLRLIRCNKHSTQRRR